MKTSIQLPSSELTTLQNFEFGATIPNSMSTALALATAGVLRSDYITTAPRSKHVPISLEMLLVVGVFGLLL